MSKKPYGATAMIAVTPQMSASNITCITNGKQQDDAPNPGGAYDDRTERPEEVSTSSELTELS